MAYSNIITRDHAGPVRYLLDVIAYRHLALNLVASDLRARFRRSRIGLLWAVLQPMAFSLLIAGVWSAILGAEDYWSFATYVFSGMLVWEYFSTTFMVSQDAFKSSEGYLKQTRIPLLIFQMRTPLSGMVILLFGFVGLLIFQATFTTPPALGPHLFLIPVFFIVLFFFTAPLAIIMSVAGAAFRDVKYISQMLVQALFFISPVMLSRGLLDSPQLLVLRTLNPLVPLLDLFRAPLFEGGFWNPAEVAVVAAWIVVLWIMAIAVSLKVGRKVVFWL